MVRLGLPRLQAHTFKKTIVPLGMTMPPYTALVVVSRGIANGRAE